MLDMLLFSFILVIIFFKKMKVASFVVGDVNLGGKHLYVDFDVKVKICIHVNAALKNDTHSECTYP